MSGFTRREFFSELCSRDTLKSVLGAWYSFQDEVKKRTEISCDDAGFMLGRKLREVSRTSKIVGKEG